MEGYMTIKQAAEKWDVTPRRIQFLCSKGRIKGATKFGRDWAISVDAKKPGDKRITTGEYKNWRKKEMRILLSKVRILWNIIYKGRARRENFL